MRPGSSSALGAVALAVTMAMPLAAPMVMLGCATGRPGAAGFQLDWQSERSRSHPLVGAVWAPREGRFVDAAALERAVAGADLVLLGELHDNPDHHRLQARLVRAAATARAAGPSIPALAFEMLEEPQQAKVDAALAAPGATPDTFAAAVAWDQSGWPRFAMYRPIVEAALELHAPIVAANFSRAQMRAIVLGTGEALPPTVQAWLDRAPAPTPAELDSLGEEMRRSHCGMMEPAMVQPLVRAQRARDAQLGVRLLAAASAAGGRAVLIAGGGHARSDRGVPALLRREAPTARAVSVGFVEVDERRRRPAQYGEDYDVAAPPFDYVVFTPATVREDPCARLKKHMERHGPAGPTAR